MPALQRRPASAGREGFSLQVEALRPAAGQLALTYRLTGPVRALRLPPPAPSRRADGLWVHTCFEAFVEGPDGAYYEFNFAPSTEWAAYRFQVYRQGMAKADVDAPLIRGEPLPDGYELRVTLALDALRDLPHDGPWRLAVSAILETTEGGRSFWALAHPPGEPDFHHPDGFVLDLPPPEPA